jgi:hypothetical protein
VLDGKVAGIAVSIGARVSALAAAGQVLVSQTVKDLVAGSGITFDDQGVQELKGVPGEWQMYAVANLSQRQARASSGERPSADCATRGPDNQGRRTFSRAAASLLPGLAPPAVLREGGVHGRYLLG